MTRKKSPRRSRKSKRRRTKSLRRRTKIKKDGSSYLLYTLQEIIDIFNNSVNTEATRLIDMEIDYIRNQVYDFCNSDQTFRQIDRDHILYRLNNVVYGLVVSRDQNTRTIIISELTLQEIINIFDNSVRTEPIRLFDIPNEYIRNQVYEFCKSDETFRQINSDHILCRLKKVVYCLVVSRIPNTRTRIICEHIEEFDPYVNKLVPGFLI